LALCAYRLLFANSASASAYLPCSLRTIAASNAELAAAASSVASAAAVVVSNHGARQLADAPPTADILAEIVDAVAGRAEVYVDGGVRRSPDVVKALALGARATLVGRPSLWALAAGGAEGVAQLLRWYEAELRRAMALVGARNVAAVDRSLVRRTPGWSLEGPLP